MILGRLDDRSLISFLSQTPALQRAFEFILAQPPDPEDGKTELEGGDLFVRTMRYPTRPRTDARWESHRHTADLQVAFGGGELIDWTPLPPVGASIEHNATDDFEFWPHAIEPVQTVHLSAGMFVIFLPGELHRPTVADGTNAMVRKFVGKVHARLLPLG